MTIYQMIRKDVDIMRDSEYIAWKSETRTQIEKEHPDWTKEQVQEFLDKVESSLRKRGFFDIAEERERND